MTVDAHSTHAPEHLDHHEIEIPFTVHARPDTGLYNGKLGIWLFLASEVMLFGALFSSLVLLRTSDPNWPHGYDILNIPLATLNTFVLISSSVTVVLAWAYLRLGDLKKAKVYLLLTLLCGFGFMIIKGIEYGTKFSHHQYPSTNNFFATYYLLTGLHGLHILGGLVALARTVPGAWGIGLAGSYRLADEFGYRLIVNHGTEGHLLADVQDVCDRIAILDRGVSARSVRLQQPRQRLRRPCHRRPPQGAPAGRHPTPRQRGLRRRPQAGRPQTQYCHRPIPIGYKRSFGRGIPGYARYFYG